MENGTKITDEEIDLLLKDLSARYPYNVYVHVHDCTHPGVHDYDNILHHSYLVYIKTREITVKPYLRSMDSMTKEERHELQEILGKDVEINDDFIRIVDSSRKIFSFLELQAVFNWLIAHHFDYLGLIPKGLALPAESMPKGTALNAREYGYV